MLDVHPKNIWDIISRSTAQHRYIFVDEVQYLSDPSNFMKFLYDTHREDMTLIVSGSSSFYLDARFHDSLAGRRYMWTLLPLSFDEFLDFQ
jgi:uncharacterized protein